MTDANLTVWESLGKSVLGIVLILAVLIAGLLLIKLFSVIGARIQKKSGADTDTETETGAAPSDGAADGGLKLIDVDEKTAALIMAIVSDKSGIPLSQLRFSTIRLTK